MSFVKWIAIFSIFLGAGCGNVTDDLAPSGEDRRPEVMAGTTGPAVGQLAPDYPVLDSLGNTEMLSSRWAKADAVVLYFTMWCPVCDSHMSNIREQVKPEFPTVEFLIVDYVTGSVDSTRRAQIENGYTDYTVIADVDQSVLNLYRATMGTTIVINSAGVVMMNEDYKDGARLREVLEALL